MKVQDVKQECLAKVGLSIEFSNSEVNAVHKLLWNVSTAIERGIEQAHKIAEETGSKYKSGRDIPVAIDLESMKRVEWLLTQCTHRKTSADLFVSADTDCEVDVDYINNELPEGGDKPVPVG